jgi:hypothetical protein
MDFTKWSRGLLIIGVVLIAAGTIDPMEGSVLILIGAALATGGALAGASPYSARLVLATFLVAIGVAALFGFSALGGIGGNSGHPLWWGVAILPYPMGWLLALISSISALRHIKRSHLQSRSLTRSGGGAEGF